MDSDVTLEQFMLEKGIFVTAVSVSCMKTMILAHMIVAGITKDSMLTMVQAGFSNTFCSNSKQVQ